MSLEQHPKFPREWKARIYPNGRKKNPATGKPSNKREPFYFTGTPAEAQAWYAELKRGAGKALTPGAAPTIDQAYPDFLAYYKNKVSKRTLDDFVLTYSRHLKGFFGQYRPGMLTSGIFEAYKTQRANDTYLPGKPGQALTDDAPGETSKRRSVSKRTVQKEISNIQAVITWMCDSETNLAAPLAFKIKNYKASQTEPPPKIIPSRRDMILLIRACRGKHDRKYRAMFAVAYYSGLRRSELFALPGKLIDQNAGYMLIKGKGEKVRTVPIVTRLKPYLKKAIKKGRLFSNPETDEEWNNLDKLLQRTCKAVGMPIISLHTFRHTFAVHAIMRGVSLRTLQLVMGHSSIKTTEKYLRLVPTDLTLDLDKVPRRIAPKRKS